MTRDMGTIAPLARTFVDEAFPSRPGPRGQVSNSIQTLIWPRAYVAAHTAGALNCESCKYENWTSRAAHGERATAAVRWYRAYRFVPDRRVGADGARGDAV